MSVADFPVRGAFALELVQGFTPDYATLHSAEDLDFKGSWGEHGWSRIESELDSRLLWAEFLNGRRASHYATILYPQLQAACTCAPARFPCRHVVALAIRDSFNKLVESPPPDWALDEFASTSRYFETRTAATDSTDDSLERELLVSGMADLEKWLGDLMRRGLVAMPQGDNRLWLDAANRLVDAYAFEPARELRELSSIPGTVPQWPERLLPRLGRLALMCRGFRRLDELALPEQGDLFSAAGFPLRPGRDTVVDDWQVRGRIISTDSKHQKARIWLWGCNTRRWALLVDDRAPGQQAGQCLPVGATLHCELAYTPSAYPLIAIPSSDFRLTQSSPTAPIASLDVDQAAGDLALALVSNPWLRVHPAILSDVFVEPILNPSPASLWRLRDRSGRIMKLPERFSQGWRLLALAADRPISLFGEWDGEIFLPLSVYIEGWRSISSWKNLA